jgi:hypothetical protein
MKDVVHVPTQKKYRTTVPDSHRKSLDTRLWWLWNQRFGTVQRVWQTSQNGDILDHTAATLILQAIIGKDLASISQLFRRLEGGPMHDQEILDKNHEESPRL